MRGMKHTRMFVVGSAACAALAVSLVALQLAAQPKAQPAPAPAAAPPGNCKTYGAGKCCHPDVTLHLAKEAVFAACGESEATFVGEYGSKETCRYHFKIAGEPDAENTFVQVYTPVVKEVPDKPTDPFMSFKKVGKVWVTDRAKSPKAAAQVAASTGLYMPGRGFFVSVAASTKVCTKPEALRLSKSIK
jgi:hypothetical protein